MSARIIGVDPGPTPGVVALVCSDNKVISTEIAQCSANLLPTVITALDPNMLAQLQVERFVVRGRATKAQSVTRDQVGVLEQLYAGAWPVALRNASEVKAWATDERLEAAGLLEATRGMRHARDAARHALFAAVRFDAIPDPLSRKASK